MFEIEGSTTHATPIPSERPCSARVRLLVAPLLVAGELERVVEARFVVAGVVETAGGGAVRELVALDQVPAAQLGRVDPEPRGGDVHRALEREVELRPAEAAVETGGTAVREHDTVSGGDVLHAVGAAQRAVHPVERRRLGART